MAEIMKIGQFFT